MFTVPTTAFQIYNIDTWDIVRVCINELVSIFLLVTSSQRETGGEMK